MSRLVLVTGATGFAGSHLMDALLAAGHRVRIPVRPTSDLRWIPREDVEMVPADVRDEASLDALTQGISWIFHFGGVVRAPRRETFFTVNTEGTRKLYQAAQRSAGEPELFLFCSSLAAGGPAPAADLPLGEEDPAAPITAYGRSKLDAEQWLQENRASGTRLVIVRPPPVYGPRDEATLALFRWIKRGILPLPSSPASLISMVDARDLADACLSLAEHEASGVFYVSDGGLHSWGKIGDLAANALGRTARRLRIPSWVVRFVGATGELLGSLTGTMPVINSDKVHDILQPYWICKIDKLRAQGFEPGIDLERGIGEAIDWYRKEGWL